MSLVGTVSAVRFYNPGTGFVVFRLRGEDGEEITVTGESQELAEGLEVRVSGRYQIHQRYGRQFRSDSILVLPPTRTRGIVTYLGSGRVPGIGKHLALRLYKHFGPRLKDVLEEGEQALRECPGIGPVKARQIALAWQKEKAQRDAFVVLAEMGLSPAQAAKVLKEYGLDAPSRVKTDPYQLVGRIPGMGFKRVDEMARRMGLSPDCSSRLRAAVLHVVDSAADAGHCFIPQDALVQQAEMLTGVEAQKFGAILRDLEAEGLLVADSVPGGDCAFYEAGLHSAEVSVSQKLSTLLREPVQNLRVGSLRTGKGLSESQRMALDVLLGSKVAVLTGGPGTGKTTLVATLLEAARKSGMEVALCAPTGRAAMRLRESTGFEAKTIHRLLEFNPVSMEFGRNELRPLEVDWVMVDESSMMDVVLLSNLLKALPPQCRLTLVGDVDQLPPVGPGDPLRDIIASKIVPTAKLTEVFRQSEGSQVIMAAYQVLRGRVPVVPRHQEGAEDFFLVQRDDAGHVADTIESLVAGRIPARFGLDPVLDVQVLAPMHRGDCGTRVLNERLRTRLNPKSLKGGRLVPGDKVIQTTNNYSKEIFNGDIGLVQSADAASGTLRVQFADRTVQLDSEDQESIHPAYAITVHKSQGSEFPCVVISLHTQHYVMLRRNLLYTAITRARRLCVVVGNLNALRMAVSNNRVERRNTLLRHRLTQSTP